MKFKTREQWLMACGKQLQKLFKAKGYDCTDDYRISCGFPKSSGIGYESIGQCWTKFVSHGSVSEIFISPTQNDPARVADIVAHELAHHIVGVKEGHNKVFGACVKAIGLEGKLTATVAGPEFTAWWNKVKGLLGEYPHHKLEPTIMKLGPTPGLPGGKLPEWVTTPRRKSGSTVKWKCGCGLKFTTSHSQAELVSQCPDRHCEETPERV